MNKIALFFVLFAVALACEPTEADKQIILENQVTDYIEIIKCLLNNEPLVKDIKTVIELVSAGEFQKLLPLLFQLYTDASAALKECVGQIDDPELEGIAKDLCLKACQKAPKFLRKICRKACDKYI